MSIKSAAGRAGGSPDRLAEGAAARVSTEGFSGSWRHFHKPPIGMRPTHLS
jgi:hypothetical protein